MKSIIYAFLTCCLLIGCNAASKVNPKPVADSNLKEQDTVRIANDDIEYEIIIIEPGFNYWLASTAKPEGYYSQSFLENRNWQYVSEWNNRVLQPFKYDPQLYEMRIDYQPGIDYGYDVNYKLYNFFIYFQLKYKQRLSGYVPRI